MYRTSLYVVALLAVLVVNAVYEIKIYQALVPSLIWSVDTLSLNVAANRAAWMACEARQ